MTARSAPAWWPSKVYYGWAIVATLGATATASYGILSYAFTAFITPMGSELGWSTTAITGAFSIAQLVAGVCAIPVGHWVDRHGTRGVMTAGSMLATVALLAWSRVQTLAGFYAVAALLGLSMAGVLYEPAFAAIATWFRAGRSRALTVLTFLGGFASVVFVPLATLLVARHGWRSALVSLAALYALLTVAPHALVLRHRPGDVGLAPDGTPGDVVDQESASTAGRAPANAHRGSEAPCSTVRGSAFRAIAFAFTLSAFTSTAVTVHLIPLLLERGATVTYAGGVVGVLGLMALPGRLIFTPLGARWSRGAVTASLFVMQATALLALLTTRDERGLWLFVVLFGAGLGAITPARAALVGDLVSPDQYGRVSGMLACLLAVARAAAPVGASLLHAAAGQETGGYEGVLGVLLALTVLAGGAVLVAGRASRRGSGVPRGTVRHWAAWLAREERRAPNA